MDWGLAKVLPRGGVADDAAAGKDRRERDGHRHGAERLGRRGPVAGRLGAGHAGLHGARAGPGRDRARSTSGPTSSPWARSSARS